MSDIEPKHHGGAFAWSMTLTGFALIAGLIFWEAYRLLSEMPTTIMDNWPVFALGGILFVGGISCFLCKPDWRGHQDDGRP